MALIRVKLPYSSKWEAATLDILKYVTVYLVVLWMSGGDLNKFVKAPPSLALFSIIMGIMAYHLVVVELFEFEYTDKVSNANGNGFILI